MNAFMLEKNDTKLSLLLLENNTETSLKQLGFE